MEKIDKRKKLTADQIKAMLRRRANGERVKDIFESMGVSHATFYYHYNRLKIGMTADDDQPVEREKPLKDGVRYIVDTGETVSAEGCGKVQTVIASDLEQIKSDIINIKEEILYTQRKALEMYDAKCKISDSLINDLKATVDALRIENAELARLLCENILRGKCNLIDVIKGKLKSIFNRNKEQK